MKLTIEPTDQLVNCSGVRCRLWEGQDENGTEVHAYFRCVQPQTHDPAQLEAFDRELELLADPSEVVITSDARP